MLTFLGRPGRYCDGVSRRSFLRIGALGLGGLTLPGLLRAEAQAGSRATGKSLINIFLNGGPTHLDTFDLKPGAPQEIRGEFQPIPTTVPGLEICELMPDLATVGERFSVIRSIAGMRDEHDPKQSESGWSMNDLQSIGGRPGVGAVLSKIYGPARVSGRGTAPTHVDLTGWTKPGFLGQVHDGYRPDGVGRDNLRLNSGISLGRLDDRRTLLNGLDRLRREVDTSGMMEAVDSFTGRAVGIITSGQLSRALDLSKEDPRTVERYGINDPQNPRRGENQRFLEARRLIDAGVRCVSFSWGGWDTHGNNFQSMREMLPPLSRALTALIEDLEARGRLDETILMMSGEFGRTPRINGTAGRDHWPRAAFFFLAGGGLRHGQAIGSTSRLGEEPRDRPVHLQHVFHTLYRVLGIDADAITLLDPNGRPQYLVEERELIRELL
ncbi:MAG TPA: DUF1501 domain-containing protein [Planctomycetaceae bacterium]|nr:DUF1501 domain-containing protein [Planctomycetaceae bacterium]